MKKMRDKVTGSEVDDNESLAVVVSEEVSLVINECAIDRRSRIK